MQTLTKGPIVKTIMKLAVPIMASYFLGTLYNICDMAWVGTLGSKTVAGVGVGGMYLWLASGLATLPRMGGQVLTAQAIGAGDMKKAKSYVKASIHIILLFSVLFGCISVIFTKQMVAFFTLADPVSVLVATRYTKITCGLVVFNFLNFTLTGLFTADGDSKTPMIANFAGLALNMILDPLLIIGIWIFPRMEDVGAAVATVFSEAVVVVVLIIKMRTRNVGSGIFKEQHYFEVCEREAYEEVIRIGLPAAIQSMAYCFMSMVLTRFVSVFGAEAVAASRVGSQIESLSWNMGDGFASAVNSFTGQNYGAKEYRRINRGYIFSLAVSLVWGAMVLCSFMLFSEPISRIFFHEEKAIAASVSYLMVMGISEPFLMAELVTGGAICGMGKTGLCSRITVVLTALRIPIGYVLMRTSLGMIGIWWAYTSTTMLKGIVFVLTFLIVRPGKDKKKIFADLKDYSN